MKQAILFLFLMYSYGIFSQQVMVKKVQSDVRNFEISTFGLDEIKIINSTTDVIEISLFDENINTHAIIIKEEFDLFKVAFELGFVEESSVFRKFITKRLHRASAVIKIPENRAISIHGNHIDVISKDYQGDLTIYIDKGLVNLNKVKGNTAITLFQGNIFATVRDTNIDVVSNHGKIKIDEVLHFKKYQQKSELIEKYLKINTINANITIENTSKINFK